MLRKGKLGPILETEGRCPPSANPLENVYIANRQSWELLVVQVFPAFTSTWEDPQTCAVQMPFLCFRAVFHAQFRKRKMSFPLRVVRDWLWNRHRQAVLVGLHEQFLSSDYILKKGCWRMFWGNSAWYRCLLTMLSNPNISSGFNVIFGSCV